MALWCSGFGLCQSGYTPPLSALAFGVGGRAMLPSIAGALLPAGIVGNPTLFGSARIGAIWGGSLAGRLMSLRAGRKVVLRG